MRAVGFVDPDKQHGPLVTFHAADDGSQQRVGIKRDLVLAADNVKLAAIADQKEARRGELTICPADAGEQSVAELLEAEVRHLRVHSVLVKLDAAVPRIRLDEAEVVRGRLLKNHELLSCRGCRRAETWSWLQEVTSTAGTATRAVTAADGMEEAGASARSELRHRTVW